jgi:Protein of unknown function (DUF2855)
VDFLISRSDLHECRFEDAPAPEPRDGEALLRVESFGLTSNNITYAAFGEAMSYWGFFPAAEGWGRMPVWGFAMVTASRAEDLAEGTRIYGYLPPSSELIVKPDRIGPHGFTDASAHADPSYEPGREDQQMLLRPLFFTSWLIDDFLRESEIFGAETVILSSASSKTASGLAFLLSRDGGPEVLGLTSSRSADYTRSIGVYDEVLTYEQLDSLPQGRAVYVDMAGDAAVREAIHIHFANDLAHSSVVGATHHDAMGGVPDSLPGPRPTFFFAPDRVVRRSADWGRPGLEQRLAEAWRPYVEWTDGWLKVSHGEGPDAIRDAYLDLLDGRIDPTSAQVLALPR